MERSYSTRHRGERIILILSSGDLFGNYHDTDYDQVITRAYTDVGLCKINKEDLMAYLVEKPPIIQ